MGEVNNEGTTLLDYAAQNDHLEVVRYLIEEERMNVNERDNYGSTAINYAATRECLEVVRYLVKHGGNNTKHNSLSTIFSLAPHILQYSDSFVITRENNLLRHNNSFSTETCLIGPVLRSVYFLHLFSPLLIILYSCLFPADIISSDLISGNLQNVSSFILFFSIMYFSPLLTQVHSKSIPLVSV